MEKTRDPFQLEGKTALISGAARGIGFGIAKELILGGANVVIGDILTQEGEAAAKSLGPKAAFVKLDVTQEEDWEEAFGFTVKRFGGIHIVCNNAGFEKSALFENCLASDFRRMHEVNALGTFLGIKHAIRNMKPGGAAGSGGSIINISSASGLKGGLTLGAYCSSKGAVRLMSKAAAVECGRLQYGIRVNSIHPGLVKTEMGMAVVRSFVELGLMPDEATAEATFVDAHLIGIGTPQDLGHAVRFLASDASRWITGIELSVDGGYNAT